MNPFLFGIWILFVFASCKQPPTQQVSQKTPLNIDSLKMVLMITDVAFSDHSASKGMNAAFMAYVDEQGTLLRPGRMPIAGKDSILAYLNARPDTAFILTWNPAFADVAESGDLGYTYGMYKLTIKSSKEYEEGTYVSIWKRQPDGRWKYVLDTGNPGLKSAQQLTM